ncbi:MAG: hypothetical protein IJ501_03255 [Bacilli bacterium]|nr:hypothetical protein [Bacilli bacterium]
MNESIDIKKQLEVKNKEIYMNKLNLDLDNNLEVLVLTIDNLLNYITSDVTKKIIEIEESFSLTEEIQDNVNKFINIYRDNLMNLLEIKKNNLQNVLVIQDDLEICRDNLNDNYLNLKNNLEDFSKENISSLVNDLKKVIEDSFKRKRLKDYLNNIFIINLNKKILDIIKNRDVILMNTFNETYLKYLELNKNTVGV